MYIITKSNIFTNCSSFQSIFIIQIMLLCIPKFSCFVHAKFGQRWSRGSGVIWRTNRHDNTQTFFIRIGKIVQPSSLSHTFSLFSSSVSAILILPNLNAYWVTQQLPQIYTANHATFPIQICKITVQICGNFWVTQYVLRRGRQCNATTWNASTWYKYCPRSFHIRSLLCLGRG